LKAKVRDRRQRKRELKAWESFLIQGAFGKEHVDMETLEEICSRVTNLGNDESEMISIHDVFQEI
jgi:hypothetical protein